MKLITTFTLALILLAGCRKTVETTVIRGKVVHRSCATVVVQVLDTAHFSLGQATWQQASNKPVYEHVFSVKNICSFPGNLPEGNEIKFELIQNDPKNKDCVTCALWDNPPTKKQEIEVVND